MTTQTVAVYTPNPQRSSGAPRNVYTLRNVRGGGGGGRAPSSGPPSTAPTSSPTPQGRGSVLGNAINHGAQQANVPRGMPRALGNSQFIILAWIVAIGFIAWDEWKRHHVLPRPARLWYTTLVYAILALLGMAGPTLPFANALAAGYTIVLVWQFFTGNGQFSDKLSESGKGISGSE